MAIATAYRVPINTPGLNFGSPPPFEGLINTDYQRLLAYKSGQKLLEQNLAGSACRPTGVAQHAVDGRCHGIYGKRVPAVTPRYVT